MIERLTYGYVWFNGISTIEGYFNVDRYLYIYIYIYIYIYQIYDLFKMFWFGGLSIIIGYLIPNTLYTRIYDL